MAREKSGRHDVSKGNPGDGKVAEVMFASRQQAGELLGRVLQNLHLVSPVVLGITRGGVVVAAEVAKILRTPLYALPVKKIGSEFNPEFAIGATGPKAGLEEDKQLGKVSKGKNVIIIDDGVATGWTLRVAVEYVREKGAKKVVAAVPVADREIAVEIRKEVDKLVVLDEVDGLGAVGNFYEDFAPVTDEKVAECISEFAPKAN